ncbi:hypothetical protein PHJA_000158100 [Phtheirospermum japonicum]|uniref:Uncharacterized protein n=1 Tax=Phtheirospermum japonicum TaxID=374723 RepID=A0A830AZQ8_9LAMI|nr:hypothetical protein PHJA_000158100 [Phtheirospermum japonicum]
MMIAHTHYIVLVTILTFGFTTMSINTDLGQHHTLSVVKRPRCLRVLNFMVYCAFSIGIDHPVRGFQRPGKRCCKYARKADILYFCEKYMTEHIHDPYRVLNILKMRIEREKYELNLIKHKCSFGLYTNRIQLGVSAH